MNLTLMYGGVKQVTNQLNSNLNKQIKNVRKYLTKERLIAISMLYKVIGMVIVLSLVPLGTMQINAQEPEPEVQVWESDLRLDVQNSVPVVLELIKPEITIGESNYQKYIREQEDAKNRALALKTAKEAESRNVVSRETPRTYTGDASFEEKRELAQRAASAYGVDWKLVEAVWQVESGKSWNTAVKSYAGAQGPMQFMPGTWRSVGIDANGDGVADANNAEDAVYSGAKYLAMNGAAAGNIDQALLAYNHAGWYVTKVKNVMNGI